MEPGSWIRTFSSESGLTPDSAGACECKEEAYWRARRIAAFGVWEDDNCKRQDKQRKSGQ